MLSKTEKKINLCNVITHNGIWTDQKTQNCVYNWLPAHATFDLTCFFSIRQSIGHHLLIAFYWYLNWCLSILFKLILNLTLKSIHVKMGSERLFFTGFGVNLFFRDTNVDLDCIFTSCLEWFEFYASNMHVKLGMARKFTFKSSNNTIFCMKDWL